LIKVAPPASTLALDSALRRLDNFDALVLTSQNAAEQVLRRRRALRLRLKARLILAVGPATSKAAKGLGPVRMAKVHRAEGLIPLIKKGWTVLWPRAEKASPVLRRPGIVAPVAYRVTPDPAGRRKYVPSDAVVFASGSAVEAFTRARLKLKGAVALSIGPVTSAALRRRGLRPVVQAKAPTPAALVRALSRHFHA
jgi:uroporphyrinogen-III synthase